MAPDIVERDTIELARRFLGKPADRIERVVGGRNSRIYRVDVGDRRYALKIYPPRAPGARDRADIECRALRFMRTHGITDVPTVVARDGGAALLEWIVGEPVMQPGLGDMDLAAQFLGQVHALSRHEGASEFDEAAEACLSGAEVLSQTVRRLERLEAEVGGHEALLQYIRGEFRPRLSDIAGRAISACREMGIRFDGDLAPANRSLIPADFGFNNALRRLDGGTTFFDFEYFGWDDPVKVCLDFVLHPAMRLAPPHARRFLGAVKQVYGSDSLFEARLKAYFPLIGARWCAILLNEFLTESWARRQYSGSLANRSDVLLNQLRLSRVLLARLNAGLEEYV